MKLEKIPACAPSLLSANFTEIASAVHLVEQSGCELVHLDIMDGHFVPNLTFGPKMLKDIRNMSDLILDTHLMVSNPEEVIDSYIDAGADILTVHFEAAVHVHRILQKIQDRGILCGISLVPSTPAELLSEILYMVDLVLVMSVNPGFGAQTFIPQSLKKIRYLDSFRKEKGLDYLISVDGGVQRGNAADIIHAGTDILVAGNAFFGSVDPPGEVPYLLGEKII